MIQHGGAVVAPVGGIETDTGFPDDHDGDQDDFGSPPSSPNENATSDEEQEKLPLPVNHVDDPLNNPLQKLAIATYIDRKAGNGVQLSIEEMASIDLLSLIKDLRIPLRSFGAICKWTGKWSTKKVDFDTMSSQSRKVFMKNLSQRIGYLPSSPLYIPFRCHVHHNQSTAFLFSRSLLHLLR
jgi:hypothetical protein